MDNIDSQKIQALSGRIIATLNDDELELLRVTFQRGRKHGIEVSFYNEDGGESETKGLGQQLLDTKMVGRNLPIINENIIVAIDITKKNIDEDRVFAMDEMHNNTDPQDNFHFQMSEYSYREWAKDNPNRHDEKN